jgi:hypothetical protein
MAQLLRTVPLYDLADATTAKTEIIKITDPNCINKLVIRFKATNNGNTATAHPAEVLSKVELKCGGKSLWSTSGIGLQADGLTENDDERRPVNIMNYIDNVMAIPSFIMNFGRYRGDTDRALDPSQLPGNLTLNITHNKALGGSVPDAGQLGVWAEIFDAPITPTGFLRTIEQYTYAPTSSMTEGNIQLDNQYPTRKLIVMSRTALKMPHEQFSRITVKNGGVKLINQEYTSNLNAIYGGKPMSETIFGKAASNALSAYVTPTFEVGVIPASIGAADYIGATQSAGGIVTMASNGSAPTIQAAVRGYMPHGALPIRFGDDLNPGTYLMPSSLTMDIIAGSSVGASSTIQILQNQDVKYANL